VEAVEDRKLMVEVLAALVVVVQEIIQELE
jgi:hypothetical protein